MVTAEIAHDAEPTPAFEIIGEGAADAVLIDAAGASQAEVGVADRGIKGLGVCRNGENGYCQQQEDELFHTIVSFRALESVPIGTEGEDDGQGGRSRGSFLFWNGSGRQCQGKRS